MATTTFNASNHANLIEQRWSKQDYSWYLKENVFAPYMGSDSNSVIQVNKDFLKKAGDNITFNLEGLLSGDGETDDGELEDNEEGLTFYDDDITIHERAHATKLNGPMTEQRTGINLRASSRRAINRWMARVHIADTMAALSGLCTKSFAGQITGANATNNAGSDIETVEAVAPEKDTDALRAFFGGQTTGGTLNRVSDDSSITNSSSQHLFGTKVIEYVKRMAELTVNSSGSAISPLRPIMVNGSPHYLLFIDPLQRKALRAETAWLDAVKEAERKGKDNPIFSGADGIWDNVIVKSIPFIHRRLGEGGTTVSEYFDSSSDAVSNGITVARAVFCGAQAVGLAWGMNPRIKAKEFDYHRKHGVAIDTIYGMKKTAFGTGSGDNETTQPFGSITIDTAVSTDAA